MFTSKSEIERKKVLFTGIIDLLVAFLWWVFSAIYIACGHGKTSSAMVCLIVPFFTVGMAFLTVGFTKFYKMITLAARCSFNLSAAAISVGMALVGVFEIAGVPTSDFLIPIWICGLASAVSGVVFLIYNKKNLTEEL